MSNATDNHLTEKLTEISDRTGFDRGDVFLTEDQVRHHFRADSQRDTFGEDAVTDQSTLDEWADMVIANRWHMAPAEFVGELWVGEEDERGRCREFHLSASLVPAERPGDGPRIEVNGTVTTRGPLGEILSQEPWGDEEPEWLTTDEAAQVDEARLRATLRASLGLDADAEEGPLEDGETAKLVKARA